MARASHLSRIAFWLGKSKQAADDKKSWLTSYWQLAQGHPADVTVNVVRMIVDLGQSATRLDVSSGAAPLHYAASVPWQLEILVVRLLAAGLRYLGLGTLATGNPGRPASGSWP